MTNPAHHPDLELCKKLTEAGFPVTELYFDSHTIEPISEWFWISTDWEYVCPSVMELLDEIQLTITWWDWKDYHLAIEPFYKEVCYRRWYKWYATEIQVIHNMRIPNALAECWLWLKENGYIKTNNS